MCGWRFIGGFAEGEEMDLNRMCMTALSEAKLFESMEHSSRFSELISCYSGYPFFNRGIAKCMYMSSWDMEHFLLILDILNDLTISRSHDLEPMKDNGKTLEQKAEGYEKYVMQLSTCFLNEEEYVMPEEEIAEKGRYIIVRTLEAAKIIDQVFEDAGR